MQNINKEWYLTRINELKVRKEFMEQQQQVFEINGFAEMVTILRKEVKFTKSDIEDLEWELNILKEINKERELLIE